MLCRRGVGCPQRWEVVAQIGMTQLRNPNGAGEVAQPVAAQISQPRVIGGWSSTISSVAADMTVWPPCARSRSRAVLLIVVPA